MKQNRLSILVLAATCLCSTAFAQSPEALYNEGKKLKEANKIKEALEKFSLAAQLKPSLTEAVYESAWCHNDLKEYTSAIIKLRQVRNSWSTVPKVYFELGWAFEKTDQPDSAKAQYQKCLFYKPDYSGAWRQLGYLAYNDDNAAEALENFRKYENNVKTTITDYLYFYRKGYCMNALKQYDSANVSLLKAASMNSKYTNTWLELGYCAKNLGDGDNAISYYKKANTLDPSSHIPYNGIAEVYRDVKKDCDEAMRWYQKSLDVKPDERKACFGIGYCMNGQGKYTEAITYLRKAIEKEATYTAAYVELGYALYKTKAFSEAITSLKKAIELNAKNENARYYLVLIYVDQRDKTNAGKYLDELRKLGSKYASQLQGKVDAL